jgi:DivIVA domain-containing protein
MYSTNPYSPAASNGDPMSPQDIRGAIFSTTRRGRRGVDENEVREFCDKIADQMTQALNQRTALEAEVRRLRDRVLGVRGETAGAAPDEAQAQAVNVLTMAQRTADRYVADAQDYSRELAQDAHLRHDEILREAQVRASIILDEAHAAAQAAADMVPASRETGLSGDGTVPPGSDAELAYLRAFSQVCRTHLRAYLDSLSKSIEEWERAEQQGLASARTSAPAHGAPAPAHGAPAPAHAPAPVHAPAPARDAGPVGVGPGHAARGAGQDTSFRDAAGPGSGDGPMVPRYATGPQGMVRTGDFGTDVGSPPMSDG